MSPAIGTRTAESLIRVKFMTRPLDRVWLRQLPNQSPRWGQCEFIFDHEARDYDWLVVYDDLPPSQGERRPMREEVLPCPQQNSILVTTEPSSIKSYLSLYTRQFGYVLTSQEAWALPHPRRIFSQPALQWYYGVGREHVITYDQMVAQPPSHKTRDLSTVCSAKQQTHTLHNQRYEFTQALKALVPEMEIFGHGVRAMDDKAEALNDYRYHLAIENYLGPHHWTEKLSDSFLGLTLPFYCGCTNAADYFPAESFIPLNIKDVEGSAEIILRTIRDNEYEKRLPHIQEARRLVLEQYNLFAVLAREIESHHSTSTNLPSGDTIASRRMLIKSSTFNGLRHLYEKTRLRMIHRFGN
jgi:hypothetical protein